ncbi:arginine deiminase [Hujiaoplasma nucleasis]|uniref:Arginine deiminase n=1 Tax=Hujiaoplasma nucleasis TaxID=2725268 RepID=A0A7L6N342_9MOLU|nr:arginine deiminase [Hujiaoplasma nucleasis]QLY40690.1 arginine deiminase [Hujiaoplasma nucleasis]
MSLLNVQSEITELKKVLLHRPGGELENLTPKWLKSLLFDDIPWLDKAREEHDAFAQIFRDAGVEVLYLADLVQESLDQDPKIKEQFIEQFIKEANITSETMKKVIFKYLMDIESTKDMVETTMSGIRKVDVPNFVKRTLSDYIRDYPFITDPMPNLYFTRDPFSVIGQGVSLSKMYSITRSRETLYGEYIFKYHPLYSKDIELYYDRTQNATIEGGDILVLSDTVLAVGVSQRTHPAAIERLAKNIFYQYKTNFKTVLAFDIPKKRAFMHLDTVFTQVDFDKFLVHNDLEKTMKAYAVTKATQGDHKLKVVPIEDKLDKILSKYLNKKITLIPCGGDDQVAGDREQWNDGANTIVIRPGEVIVYERNHITNDILESLGVKVHKMPSSELSRGRGGPRCMSMPFNRE